MTQKAIQIGNSVGIILPQSLREEVGINAGDEISLERKDSDIVLSSAKKKLAPAVDAKFAKIVDEFISEHEDVLKELAHR